MTDAILAIDQGTSSSRAMVFAADGQLLLQAQQEICCSYPHEGWVEQDPEQIWLSVLTVCREVLQQAKQQGITIKGIGITNQRETSSGLAAR